MPGLSLAQDDLAAAERALELATKRVELSLMKPSRDDLARAVLSIAASGERDVTRLATGALDAAYARLQASTTRE